MTRTRPARPRSRVTTMIAVALAAALFSAFFVSCSTSGTVIAPPPSPAADAGDLPPGLPQGGLSEEALATVRHDPQALAVARFYHGIETGNIDDENLSLAPAWVDVPLADGQGPGRAGFASVLQTYHQAFPNLRVHIDEIAVAGDTITSRNTLTGNQDGPFLGVAPTGRVVTFRTTDVHHLRNGLIESSYHLEDLNGAYQQVIAR